MNFRAKYNKELYAEYLARGEEIIALRRRVRDLEDQLNECMAMHETVHQDGGPWYEQYKRVQ